MTLRELAEKSDQEVKYWKSQKSKLFESNCNIEANLDKLSQKVTKVEEKISENTRTHIAKKQELKDLQSTRTNLSHKQWNDCLSETGRYANDFSEWITNYSRNVLMKEIESHRKDCSKVSEELAVLEQEVNDMREKYDLGYTEANVDDDDLSNLDSAIFDVRSCNNNLMKNVKLEEDTLNKLQSKIKQSNIALHESKAKKQTNMF
ncbi:PREDICTED: uncharacterized protein LOC105569411 [Vollenhovia emeryi]|uniref:uncharacterized protein LOC105569411 n=1 Tax=Vollenhovia emeryi TaxID=411798 RepID=UPI0005F413C2|nr:PREDICTED: uncharacterized protein LOC105569411 [Vollenhovia emeryi]